MITLAHFTQLEFPIGLFIFLLGFAAGLAAAHARSWAVSMRTYPWAFGPTMMLALMFVSATARADVIISEIMYNPSGSDSNKEWVEIFNNGPTSVNLGGWVFEDIQDMNAATAIPSGTMLGPDQSLVLVGDATNFDTKWGTGINRIELGNFPALDNTPSATNEILAIKDKFGVVRDQVNYDSGKGWPLNVNCCTNGPSIYVLPEFLTSSGNDIGSNWSHSTPLIDGSSYSLASPSLEKASPGIVATEPTVFPAFTPSPDAAWSMVVFPDTQYYVNTPDQAFMPFFVDMAEWVRDNRDAFNIQVVLHEGDIVNRNSDESPGSGENPSTLQWQNAQAAMGILNGEVPYIFAMGNHDVGISDARSEPENRTTRFNDFFPPSDNPLVDPLQGGILKGVMVSDHLENAYFEVTAPDGRQLLIVSLAWDPLTEQLSWANQIVSQSKYDAHTAILHIHTYLESDDIRNSDGEIAWNELVKANGNFEMVFNGHVPGDGAGYLVSTGVEGNQVHQMAFNTQSEGNGGNGWIRVLEFLEDGQTVRVRTYSPSLGYIRDDAANEFMFELTRISHGESRKGDFSRFLDAGLGQSLR